MIPPPAAWKAAALPDELSALGDPDQGFAPRPRGPEPRVILARPIRNVRLLTVAQDLDLAKNPVVCYGE